MGPNGRFYSCLCFDVDWDRLGILGRAPRKRETLLEFRE